MKKLVQWGAGNIGRSFIGQIFSRNGCEVTFVDVDKKLIAALSSAGEYRVITLSDRERSVIRVTNVRALSADDEEEVRLAILDADYLSFSVGKNVLPKIASRIADLIRYRHDRRPDAPLDIIIAENVHDGSDFMHSLLLPFLSRDFPFDSYIGLVETSLGKMVPLQTSKDVLEVYAEPYNTLIVDRDGFRGTFPDFPQIRAVSPISAYVSSKLYIHNLGHAATAYLGFRADPTVRYVWECLAISGVRSEVKDAMCQAASALKAEYPLTFADGELSSHIEELLSRFANRALGDTVFRVGRDLGRKLALGDRFLGAIFLAEKHSLPWEYIGKAYLSAFSFDARSEDGAFFLPDTVLLDRLAGKSMEERIRMVAGAVDGAVESEMLERALKGFAKIT